MIQYYIGIIICIVAIVLLIYNMLTYKKKADKKLQDTIKNTEDSLCSQLGNKLNDIQTSYQKAFNTLSIPKGTERIDVETTVFGLKNEAISYNGEEYLLNCFYIWNDNNAVNIFPTEDHTKIEHMRYYNNHQYILSHLNADDIHLISIPIKEIQYYRICGDEGVKIIENENHSPNLKGAMIGAIVAGETGAAIGALTPQKKKQFYYRYDKRYIEIIYEENGLKRELNVSINALSLFETWMPEKEYSQFEYRKMKS